MITQGDRGIPTVDIADSALESRHMEASRAAPISAIPARSLDISSEGGMGLLVTVASARRAAAASGKLR
jgi:hypothetical protein